MQLITQAFSSNWMSRYSASIIFWSVLLIFYQLSSLPVQAQGKKLSEPMLDLLRLKSVDEAQVWDKSESDLLVKGVNILTGEGEILTNNDVLIRDGKFYSLSVLIRASSSARVIEASNKWVTPGYIDVVPFVTMTESSNPFHSIDSSKSLGYAIDRLDSSHPYFYQASSAGVTSVLFYDPSAPLQIASLMHTSPKHSRYQMQVPGKSNLLVATCPNDDASALDGRFFGIDERNLPSSRYHEAVLQASWHRQINTVIMCDESDALAKLVRRAKQLKLSLSAVGGTEAYKLAPVIPSQVCMLSGFADARLSRKDFTSFAPAISLKRNNYSGCSAVTSSKASHSNLLPLTTGRYIPLLKEIGQESSYENLIAWSTANTARALGLGNQLGRIKTGYSADFIIWNDDPTLSSSYIEKVYIRGTLVFDITNQASSMTVDAQLGR